MSLVQRDGSINSPHNDMQAAQYGHSDDVSTQSVRSSASVRRWFSLSLMASALAAIGLPVAAQVAPDAGRTLQEMAPAPLPPQPSPGIDIQVPAGDATAPGGAQAVVQSVRFSGNTLFDNATLENQLGEFTSRSFDLAGLRGLASDITAFYQHHGYPFARAFLPAQPLETGQLHIHIVEGRYGQVRALGDPTLARQGQRYLSALTPGAVIESASLERASLILSDLPGIQAAPVVRPGEQVGTGDLDVHLKRGPRYTGDVGVDNHGNYYSGQLRARASLNVNSPFMLGDQINLRAIYTQDTLWMGSLGYSAPLGASGLRGNLSYTQTHYDLAHGFEGNKGIARISSAGLSYPLLRSQARNLSLTAAVQHKNLYNSYFYGASADKYSSMTLPLGLSFDARDTIGGGGVTYGGLTWTHGDLRKNDPVRKGSFDKLNLDLMRLQALPGNLTLYARVSGQWAGKNLDSSETMFLGGPSGVRAYPTGEAGGDMGWLAQIELRYQAGMFSPYVFYDHGRIKVNAKPEKVAMPSPDLHRSGAGVGVRVNRGPWSLDGVLAWRIKGGQPTSDTHADPKPRLWLTASYAF
jgi:hemolysin activation/secretion protein